MNTSTQEDKNKEIKASIQQLLKQVTIQDNVIKPVYTNPKNITDLRVILRVQARDAAPSGLSGARPQVMPVQTLRPKPDRVARLAAHKNNKSHKR